MKIFRAVGLGILILTLQFLVPEIFSALEGTLIMFFETVQNGLEVTNSQLATPIQAQ